MNEIYYFCFSPDNKLVAVPLTDGTLKVWDVTTGKVAATYSGPDLRLLGVTFAPDGKSIAAVFVPKSYALDFREDWTLVIWDTATGKEKLRDPKWNGVLVGYTPDGSKLLSASLNDRSGEVLLADAATGKVVTRIPHGYGHIAGLTTSADGKRLVVAGDDNAIVVWNLATGKPVHDLDGPRGYFYTLAFSPDGKTLLVSEPERAAGLWDTHTGKRKHRLSANGKGNIMSAMFTPNGEQVVIGYFDHWATGENVVARLWNVTDGKLAREYTMRTIAPFNLTLSPDGKELLTKQKDQVVVLDFGTGKQTKEIAGAKDGDTLLAYTKIGELIEIRQAAQLVNVQQIVATNLLSNKVIGKWGVESVSYLTALSPDGRFVALKEPAGAGGKVMRIRRVTTGEEVCTLPFEYVDQTTHIAFSRDGRFLAASHGDAAHLFDTATGKEVRVFRGHTGRINVLAFNPDGTRLATGSSDTTVLIWDLTAKP